MIHVVESHEQVLELWEEQGLQSQHVAHLDFHCDLRGLLIDRRRQRAFRIWDRYSSVDQGNFLTHAVLQGRVDRIRWVHDEPGGRRDDVKTVKYETDLTAQLHRAAIALSRRRGIPIGYEVVPAAEWRGLEAGEILDVDWDFFACNQYPRHTVERRVAEFLSRDFSVIPRRVYVCYSPDYSHPTRKEFGRFVTDMANIFEATVVETHPVIVNREPSAAKRHGVVSVVANRLRRLRHNTEVALRRRGIF